MCALSEVMVYPDPVTALKTMRCTFRAFTQSRTTCSGKDWRTGEQTIVFKTKLFFTALTGCSV